MEFKTILYIIGGVSIALLLTYVYYLIVSVVLHMLYPTATILETIAVALIMSWFIPRQIKK